MRTARESFKSSAFAVVLVLSAATAVFAGEVPTLPTATGMMRATKKVTPDFPVAAKQLHVTGTQEVEITVNKTGDVTATKVLKGNMMFSNSSTNAAKQWKFTPLVKDGAASEFVTVLVFSYGQ